MAAPVVPQGKGRFWGAVAASESESESDDDKDADAGAGAPAPAAASRFAAYQRASDSDEGGTRVARSAKERVIDR